MLHCDEIYLGPRKFMEDEWQLVDGDIKEDYELVEGSASELAMDPRAVAVKIVLVRGSRLQLKLQSWEAAEPHSPGDLPLPLYGGSSSNTPPRPCTASSEASAVPPTLLPPNQASGGDPSKAPADRVTYKKQPQGPPIQPCHLQMERKEMDLPDSSAATAVAAGQSPASVIPISSSQRQNQLLVLGLAKAAPAPSRRRRGSVVLFLPCAAVILVVAAARTFFRQRRSNS